MKSDVFLKDFFSKCEQIRRYLQVTLSENVSIWFLKLYTRMTYFLLFSFLRVLEYKSEKWEPFFADWLRKRNLRTHRVQLPLTLPRSYRDEMENRRAYVVIFYIWLLYFFFRRSHIFFGTTLSHKTSW